MLVFITHGPQIVSLVKGLYDRTVLLTERGSRGHVKTITNVTFRSITICMAGETLNPGTIKPFAPVYCCYIVYEWPKLGRSNI